MLTHALVALPCLGDGGCLSQERPVENEGSGTCGIRHNIAAGQLRPLAISLPVQPATPQHLPSSDQSPLTSNLPVSEESRGSRKGGFIPGYLFPSSKPAKRRNSALSILRLPCRTTLHDSQQHSLLQSDWIRQGSSCSTLAQQEPMEHRTVNYPGCASYCSTCALLFWVLVLKTASHTAQGNGEGITVPPDDGTCHPRCHPVRWQLCKARARSLQKQVQHREALGRLQICLPSHPRGIVTMSLPNPHAGREIL